MKKTMTMIGLLAFATTAFTQDEVVTAYKYKKLKLKEEITLVDENVFDIESVAVSNDGQRICWIGKPKNKDWQYPADIFMKQTSAKTTDMPRKLKKSKRLNAFSKCAFNNEGNILASELFWRPLAITSSLIHSLRNGDFEPK